MEDSGTPRKILRLSDPQGVTIVDAWDLLVRHHAGSHSAVVSGRAGVTFPGDDPFEDLSDAQLRIQPHGLNSIAWLIWHIARTEDVSVNVLLMSEAQILDGENWLSRLKVSRRDVGTEMASGEIEDLSRVIDIDNLRAYRIAVGKRTRTLLTDLRRTEWESPIDPGHIRKALEQGALAPHAAWLGEDWAKADKGWLLHYEVIAHNWLHLGQALSVRKLLLAGAP